MRIRFADGAVNHAFSRSASQQRIRRKLCSEQLKAVRDHEYRSLTVLTVHNKPILKVDQTLFSGQYFRLLPAELLAERCLISVQGVTNEALEVVQNVFAHVAPLFIYEQPTAVVPK